MQLTTVACLLSLRVETLPTTTELEEDPSMGKSLRMKTSLWNTPDLWRCLWPTLGQTPMDPSFLFALQRLSGKLEPGLQIATHMILVDFLTLLFSLQAGWEARGVRSSSGRWRVCQKNGGSWPRVWQNQAEGYNRWLWSTIMQRLLPVFGPLHLLGQCFPVKLLVNLQATMLNDVDT